MKQIKMIATTLLTGILALLISGNAVASWSWYLTGDTGKVWSVSKSGSGTSSGMLPPGVTATGWSNANASSSTSTASPYGTGNLVQRQVEIYGSSGIGVWSPTDSGSGGTHSTDNNYHIDSVLLDFGGTSVTLDQVRFGWVADSDFSVAAYTGGGSTDLASMGYADLAGNGWATIGSYLNNGTTSTTNINAGDISSSYWLISALNPSLDGPSDRGYYGNDKFKMKFLGGSKPDRPPVGVPEPSTLLLLGGALLVVVMRRRLLQGRNGLCVVEA